jgi:hypothetical protein
MSAEPRRRLTELVFLDRGPWAMRAFIVIIVGIAAGAAGDALLRLEQHLAVQRATGAALNPLENLLASGSSVRTAWVGWVAALFYVVAIVRLRRGPIEPSVGRLPVERQTATQLRAGLRREYALVRVLLVAVTLITAVDVARAVALVIAARSMGQSPTLVATVVEAAGLVAASLMLAAWAWLFGADLRRLGAM